MVTLNSIIENKKVPQILSLSSKRVEEWSEHSWKWLHRIRTALLGRVAGDKRISTRTLRIEQRVAIQKLLSTILAHIDLKTMCIGYYDKKTGIFINLGIEYLAKKSGLNQRRAQRALQWLYQSGYIIGHRRTVIDEDTGEFIHKTSIRKISLILFRDLGITEIALNRARNTSRKRAENFVLRTLRNTKKNTSNTINGIISNISNSLSPSPRQKQIDLPQLYLERIEQLKHMFPDMSLHEIKALLPSPSAYK